MISDSLKLTALVRARLLFSDEVAIDLHTKRNLLDKEYLVKLIEMMRVHEIQRNNFLRTFVILLFIFFIISNENSISIPGLGVKLPDIPGAKSFLLLISGTVFVLTCYCHITIQMYDALIDQIIQKFSGDGLIDPDVIKSAYVPFHFTLKLTRDRFNIYDPNERIKLGNAAKIYLRIINVLGMVFLISIWLFPSFVMIFFAYWYFYGWFGIVVKFIISSMWLLGIGILALEWIQFRYRISSEWASDEGHQAQE